MQRTFFFSAIFLVSLLFSCKKDGELSPDFDNGNLSIIYTDTFSLKTSVIEESSGRTDLAVYHLLGVYNDPIFGMKSSSIYTNIGLAGSSTNFGNTVTIDSIVVALKPVGFYGNSTSSLTINVFELSTPLVAANDYYSNSHTSSRSILLGNKVFTPGSTDSILRIKLTDPSLISEIENKASFTNNADLNSIFNGLQIVTSDTAGSSSSIPQNTGAISYFDLNSSLSGVIVYYNNSEEDSLQEKFIINSDIKSYSRFINDYTSTDVEKHINNDPSKNTNRTYVSAMRGVKTKIELPTIKELSKEGTIAINKAEITFTVENGTDDSPNEILSSLALTGIDANEDAVVLLDDPSIEGLEHYGGTYNSTTKSITFNITKHIHQLINNPAIDYGMYLLAKGSVTRANRAVITSENSPISKIKLEITYSKL